MKKILSWIGAFGLTATAGLTAVACVIQTPTKPFFNNIRDITNRSWNLNTKQFLTSEITTGNDFTTVEKGSYFYQSVVADFKNMEDVDQYFTTNPFQYQVVGTEPARNGYVQHYLNLRVETQANNIINGFVVRTYEGKTRLSTDQSQALSVNLNEREEGDTTSRTVADRMYDELTRLARLYQDSYRPSNAPRAFILDRFRSFDVMLRTAVITKLEETYLPTFNSEENILYENLAQQLRYLDEQFGPLNETILSAFEGLEPNSEVRRETIMAIDSLKQLTWGNITITLAS